MRVIATQLQNRECTTSRASLGFYPSPGRRRPGSCGNNNNTITITTSPLRSGSTSSMVRVFSSSFFHFSSFVVVARCRCSVDFATRSVRESIASFRFADVPFSLSLSVSLVCFCVFTLWFGNKQNDSGL